MIETVAPESWSGPPRLRRVWRALAVLFVTAVLLGPFFLINRAFALTTENMDETFHMLLRFSALMGISLLFLQIASGAFRPVLARVFAPEALSQFHKGFGVAAFGFLVLHFLFLIHSIGEHWAELDHGFFLLGPIMLAVIAVTVTAAFMRRRLRSGLWIRLHVINYLVFPVGAIHGLGIGTQTGTVAARVVFGVYLASAMAGLLYRASSPAWRRRLALSPARLRGVS
jgi:hypothetical protein